MIELNGRTAFVTGAASGIGLGIARALVREGVKVAMADIDGDTIAAAAAELAAEGGETLALTLDIARRADWAAAADEAERALGPVSLLVNNAGVSTSGRHVEDVPGEFWDHVVAINLTGAFNGCSTFVPRIKAAGNGGHIVNTASISGLVVTAGQAPYNATKFGLMALSETLRLELADDGIGVSVLCPGPVRTLLWRTSRKVQGLPDIDTPPEPAARGGSAAPHALDPLWAGELVVAAIRADQMYIITHPDRIDQVEARFDRVRAGFAWADDEAVRNPPRR